MRTHASHANDIEMAAIRIYRIIAILYLKTAILCALFRLNRHFVRAIPDAFFFAFISIARFRRRISRSTWTTIVTIIPIITIVTIITIITIVAIITIITILTIITII